MQPADRIERRPDGKLAGWLVQVLQPFVFNPASIAAHAPHWVLSIGTSWDPSATPFLL